MCLSPCTCEHIHPFLCRGSHYPGLEVSQHIGIVYIYVCIYKHLIIQFCMVQLVFF